MKQFVLLAAMLAGNAFGQITIDSADIVSSVGDSWSYKYCQNTVTVDIGSAGGPQAWTFDTAGFAGYVLTMGCVDIAATPFPTQFPQATGAFREERGPWTLYYFRRLEADAMYDLGFGLEAGGTTKAYRYTPASVHLQLPATLGTAWQSNYYYTDSLDDTTCVRTMYALINHVDAWGTGTTPAGTWPCLRRNVIERMREETWVNGALATAESSMTRRCFWGAAGVGTIAMAHSLENDTNPSFTTADDVMYLTRTNTAAVTNEPAGNRPRISIAPNPARGGATLHYSLAAAGPALAQVRDRSGRLVRVLVSASQAPGSHAVRWDGRDSGGRAVPAGIYFVNLTADGIESLAKLVLAR